MVENNREDLKVDLKNVNWSWLKKMWMIKISSFKNIFTLFTWILFCYVIIKTMSIDWGWAMLALIGVTGATNVAQKIVLKK